MTRIMLPGVYSKKNERDIAISRRAGPLRRIGPIGRFARFDPLRASTLPGMTPWLVVLALTPHPPVQIISLLRGGELPGQAIRYWAVEDTYLDSTAQEGNFGGSNYLEAGPGRTLLIRFGDLRRALGPNKRITDAKLTFTITGGNPAGLAQASEVLVPWGEGPAQVIAYAATPPTLSAPTWSASWKHRRSGENAIAWQQPGAAGVSDAKPLADVRAINSDSDHIRLEGLATWAQRAYERPYDRFGLSLRFDAAIEFASSQAQSGRPVLELQFEEAPATPGPDLAVLRIERTPEYPRFGKPADVLAGSQDGAEVPIPTPPADAKEKRWPSNGEEVTYTAVIRNVGSAPATGFGARWSVRERPGSTIESDKALAPGEETTLTLKQGFRNQHADHRIQPIGLVIEPKGPDAVLSNNGLTIQEGALSVGFVFEPTMSGHIGEKLPLGAQNADEFAQAIVNFWNETLLPQSRFSFAPEGALERLRLQSVKSVPVPGKPGPEFVPEPEPNLDVNLSIRMGADFSKPGTLLRLIQTMAREMGIPDLASMNFGAMFGRIKQAGQTIEVGSSDISPGVLGGGDTRFDGAVPRQIALNYEPVVSELYAALPIEETDLLSATAVGALNDALGLRRGFTPEALWKLPSTVLLRLFDGAGLPVKNASVDVFPMANGEINVGTAVARLASGASGSILLTPRSTGLPEGFKTPLGNTIAANPFGRISPEGANGVVMFKVLADGQIDYAFLKVWQLADLFRRSASPTPVLDLHLNISGDLNRSEDLAKNRIVTDSMNSLPAKLAALVDGSNTTAAEISGGKDAWIELDLGRDRVFGEVRIVPRGPFWEKFDVLTYATGQTSADAKPMFREASWSWRMQNRSDSEAEGERSVGYRTPGIRARFIRIKRTSDGPPASLAEIRVIPLRGP